jgi:hypothetical protein
LRLIELVDEVLSNRRDLVLLMGKRVSTYRAKTPREIERKNEDG